MLPLWRKRTDQHGRAYKKSQLQAQLYVNRQCALTEAVLNALPSLAKLRPSLLWTSVETNSLVERDAVAAPALGVAPSGHRAGAARGGARLDLVPIVPVALP